MDKDLRKLKKDLHKQHYRLVQTPNSHTLVFTPAGERIATLPHNTGSWRQIKNAMADLRRGGYQPSK